MSLDWLTSLWLYVGLVAAVGYRESCLFTEEELEEVERVVRRDRVGRDRRVFFEVGLGFGFLSFACALVSKNCVCVSARLSLEVLPCSASRVRRLFKKKNTISRYSRSRMEAHIYVESTQNRKYRRVAVGTRRRTRLVLFALPFSRVEWLKKSENSR